jgi:hypothetical protein
MKRVQITALAALLATVAAGCGAEGVTEQLTAPGAGPRGDIAENDTTGRGGGWVGSGNAAALPDGGATTADGGGGWFGSGN